MSVMPGYDRPTFIMTRRSARPMAGTGPAAPPKQPASNGIDSVWLAIPDVVDLEELEDQLAALPGNYIRIKGIARAVDGRVGATGGSSACIS